MAATTLPSSEQSRPEVAPAWVTEEMLSATERIGDRQAVLWMSEN